MIRPFERQGGRQEEIETGLLSGWIDRLVRNQRLALEQVFYFKQKLRCDVLFASNTPTKVLWRNLLFLYLVVCTLFAAETIFTLLFADVEYYKLIQCISILWLALSMFVIKRISWGRIPWICFLVTVFSSHLFIRHFVTADFRVTGMYLGIVLLQFLVQFTASRVFGLATTLFSTLVGFFVAIGSFSEINRRDLSNIHYKDAAYITSSTLFLSFCSWFFYSQLSSIRKKGFRVFKLVRKPSGASFQSGSENVRSTSSVPTSIWSADELMSNTVAVIQEDGRIQMGKVCRVQRNEAEVQWFEHIDEQIYGLTERRSFIGFQSIFCLVRMKHSQEERWIMNPND